MWENNKYVDALSNWFNSTAADHSGGWQTPASSPAAAANNANKVGANVGAQIGSAVEPNPNDMGGQGVLAPSEDNVGPYAPPASSGGSITDFDMNDPESVKALQTRLGVKADGMFGPKTEEAYRMAVDAERQDAGKESYEYDYNEQVADEKKFKPFGGLFRNAYRNLDKNVFKGKLPGGQSDKNVMTAEEFYNK